jgi:HEAT repeat protein
LQELAYLRDPRVSTVFRLALNDDTPKTRHAAAWYLGQTNEIRAVNALTKLASGWRLRDRFYGMAALAKLSITTAQF